MLRVSSNKLCDLYAGSCAVRPVQCMYFMMGSFNTSKAYKIFILWPHVRKKGSVAMPGRNGGVKLIWNLGRRVLRTSGCSWLRIITTWRIVLFVCLSCWTWGGGGFNQLQITLKHAGFCSSVHIPTIVIYFTFYSFLSLNAVHYVFLIFCNFAYWGLPWVLYVVLCDVCFLYCIELYCIVLSYLAL
jgi:hypothetical protein